MDVFLRNLAVGRRSFNDPFFEDGDKTCSLFERMCVFDIDEEELCHNVSKKFSCDVPGCTSTFETLLEFEVHYNTLHRYVCSVCHKILPSPHFLDLHIEENHDSFFSLQAERKPMYQCLVEDCKTKFRTSKERKDHCIKTHSFPRSFRWFILVGNPQNIKHKSFKLKKVKHVDAEMADSLDCTIIEADKEECMGNESTEQLEMKQTHKQRKNKESVKTVNMDFDSENNGGSVSKQEGTPSNEVDLTKSSKRSPAPFKGFIPRNINANRAFRQKSYFKGRNWHQNTTLSSSATSSLALESGNLSVDLRDSLPTDT